MCRLPHAWQYLLVLAPVSPALAQQQTGPAPPAQPNAQATGRTIQVSNQNYTQGKRLFPHIFAPYVPTPVPEPVLVNSPSLEQMIKDGKLTISLQEAIDLALQNNLDISIQRYAPWLAEANILRTLSGARRRRNHFRLWAISLRMNFDPQVTSTFSLDSRSIPVNNPITAGVGGSASVGTFSTLGTHAAIGDLTYSQGFHTGTAFSATFQQHAHFHDER